MMDVMNGAEAADGAKAVAATTFAIRAIASSEALPRVLAVFAQRGILPRQVACSHRDEWLVIDIDVEEMGAPVASILLEKLRSMVLVNRAAIVGSKA